jgi:flagellar biosynthesis chaperone FliJ
MSQQQLKLVLELKVREEHAALEQFKLAQQQVQLAQQKQAQLEAYREQYIVQLTQPDAQLSVQQITQIQRFISKLDQACAAQAAQFSKAVLAKRSGNSANKNAARSKNSSVAKTRKPTPCACAKNKKITMILPCNSFCAPANNPKTSHQWSRQ